MSTRTFDEEFAYLSEEEIMGLFLGNRDKSMAVMEQCKRRGHTRAGLNYYNIYIYMRPESVA